MADEIAAAIGAKTIDIWEVDRDRVTPLSSQSLSPPSRKELEGLVSVGGALRDYGVVIDATGAVDEAASVAARSSRRSSALGSPP